MCYGEKRASPVITLLVILFHPSRKELEEEPRRAPIERVRGRCSPVTDYDIIMR
jgi:hypothetical protein